MDRFELLREMLAADRSVRRFDASYIVSNATLERLVGLTRLCASGRNLQPLRYRLVTDEEERNALFPALAWAGYYKDWDGPSEEERPTAYLVQCLDADLADNCLCDDGLQLQAITLGATAIGLSCCIIKAFNAESVVKALHLPGNCKPRYVVAIGKAAEKVRLTEMPADGDYKYFRDADDAQCVPKRPLSEIIIKS